MKQVDEMWIGALILMPAAVEIGKKIKAMEDHEVFIAVTDDDTMLIEIPQWCNLSGHKLLKVERRGEVIRFFIEKVPPFLRPKKFGPKDVPAIELVQYGDTGFDEWRSW
jgi:TusA-related sulfurtransferase